MADAANLSDDDLKRARDLGAATYVTAYVTMMAKELGIKDIDLAAANALAMHMVEPLNLATEATFRKLMEDDAGTADTLRRFHMALKQLP